MPAFFLPAAPPEMTVLDGVASTVKSDRVSWIIIVEPALTMGGGHRIVRKITIRNDGARCEITSGRQSAAYRHGSPFMTVLNLTH